MKTILVAVSPGAETTRILALRGPGETILKAHLSLRPGSTRALASLLETITLWEGAPVSAALVVGDASTNSSTSLLHDNFTVFGEEAGPWRLRWTVLTDRRRRGGLSRKGDFGDLARLLTRPAFR
jgi:hypothetical protein